MSPGLIVYRVHTTLADRPVTGSDSCIARIPPELYVIAPGTGRPPVLNLGFLNMFLRHASENAAAGIGERLHHAEWVTTDDPEVVETRGIHSPGCLTCRAAVDQALAHLAGGGAPLLVGTLYWAG